MNIALYGGSFNPPHKGHRLAAKAIHAQLKPDLLLIMPNRTNPSKQGAKSFPTPEQRLELCALAFDGLPRTQVSDLEVRREGPTYTADTIGELSRLYPGCRITLVLGSDMLENLPNWARFEEFSKQCSFAVLLRYADRTETVHRRIAELQQSCGIEISCVENRILEMGSFSIRQQLAQRGGRDCLRGSVYARIIQQRYYDALPELAWLREQA
ncbi:MAG: nicotinate (nicotinamide) nucleotide adenylyltransferase [Oscillospiraceae bacterium]|nr:nicotinate (nicotinamide) nucleotide adenylyltransferase [Oscillospiraceae bacterium]